MIVKNYLILAEGVSIFYTMDVSLLSQQDTIPLYTMDMEKIQSSRRVVILRNDDNF